jgi:hypothetical protein
VTSSAQGAEEDGRILSTAKAFFRQDRWPYAKLEGRTVLQVAVGTGDHRWSGFAQADETLARFVFYSVSPWTAPEHRRVEFAEFFTRINWGMVIGNFEMDWDDGEIRYKSAIDVTGDRISQPLVRQVVYPNVRAMGRYLPAIRAILDGEQSAREAAATADPSSSTAGDNPVER